ncbi:hypothetical protein [Hydrogenophaga sp.]|uniref:hypothetical protein n=1 Tax=Hydrogenophaga sp. TaxID=1904254 RepID=UPI0025C740E1|nr:hypothetical protein [Hydrogenophaga sp.]
MTTLSHEPSAASANWSLVPVNDGVVRVQGADGLLVGNLKRVGTVWKFKAVGFDADGALVPGGGPLTDRHNTVFTHLDTGAVNAALAPARG